jgi:hypothetical protein
MCSSSAGSASRKNLRKFVSESPTKQACSGFLAALTVLGTFGLYGEVFLSFSPLALTRLNPHVRFRLGYD